MPLDIRGKNKWKRSIFDLFILIDEQRDIWRVFEGIYIAGMVFDHFNKISIVLFACSFFSGFSEGSYLVKVFTFVRVDVLVSSYLSQYTFALIFMVLFMVDFMFKILVFLQILYKKNIHFTVFVQGGRAVRIMLYCILKVPIINFGLDCALTYAISNEVFEYGEGLLSNYMEVKVLFIIALFFYLPVLLFEIILSNIPNYKKSTFSYTHSLIFLKETIFIVLLVVCKYNINSKFFFLVSLITSLYLCYSFYYFLPFFNNSLNIFYIHTWASISFFSLLGLIADIYNNFMIIEVVLPFIYIALVFITKEQLSKRILKIMKKTTFNNPYTAEIKIRSILLNSSKVSQNTVSDHFRVSTKDFFSFKIQYIWESIIYFYHLKNKKVAMMKLAKVKMCEYKNLSDNIQSNLSKTFSYPISLEAEFFHYALFTIFIKKVPDMGYDILLLSFSKNYKTFLEFEKKLLRKLLTCTNSFLIENSSKTFDKKLNKLGDLIRNYFTLANKMTKKYGDEKEFLKIFESFCEDILNFNNVKISGTKGHRRIGRQVTKKMLNFEDSGSVFVISGNVENIGCIMFLNKNACNLLNIENNQDLIGRSFLCLIPKPFDAIHNDILMKFIMFRESTKLRRNNICVIDSFGHCIEVTMSFRLSFYKEGVYFILTLKQIFPVQNIILASPEGNIYSVSCNLTDYIEITSCELFVAVPRIDALIKEYGEHEVFFYSENGLNLYMKYKILRIDSYELLMIYVIDPKNKSKLMQENWNITSHSESVNDKSKLSEFNINIENDENEKYKNKIFWKKYLKSTKILSVIVKVFSVIQICLMIFTLITIYELTYSITLNSIIFDVGLMRYLSSSVLSNIYSLDLLSQNYTLAYSEETYRYTLKSNLDSLQNSLSKYQQIVLPITNEARNYFQEEKLSIYYETSKSSYQETEYLLNIMNIFIHNSLKISNTSLASFSSIESEKLFLYKNIPTSYINTLNKTVFRIMDDFNHSINKIFSYLKYSELLCIFFPVFLLLSSCLCLVFIEFGNRILWKMLNKIDTDRLNKLRKKINDRLRYTHKIVEELDKLYQKSPKKHYSPIIIIPILKIIGFIAISIVFYLVVTIGSQAMLNNMMEHDLIHTNFGGLRRMLAPLSLFWVRNTILESAERNSFKDLFKEDSVASSKDQLNSIIEMYLSTQSHLMDMLQSYPLNLYSFSDYIDLMYGDSCKYITAINNCSSSFVSSGLDLALKFYLQELIYVMNINETGDYMKNMITIEKYSKTIEKSFVYGLFVYSNYTTGVIKDIKKDLTLTVLYFCLGTIFFYILFLRKYTDDITLLFENKVFITSSLSSNGDLDNNK